AEHLDDDRADRDDLAGLDEVRAETAGDRALEVHRRLVRLDLGDGLVGGDRIAGLLEPPDEERLAHRDAHCRTSDDARHRQRADPSALLFALSSTLMESFPRN